ncbi:MAG: ribonuclease J [Candidatus Magasanikbacteria bacterium]|nr:ribonuclease J [Candidatus Magasanikbacteria bacterium]
MSPAKERNERAGRRPRGNRPFSRERGERGRAPNRQPADRARVITSTGEKTAGDDKLRIMVLGGCEEVGRNCTLLEYKDDIILIDMGLQFPEEDMPGIDYIVPNMSYLRGKERKIRGVIITHGHYDHIGAIPHTIPNIGNPTIYALPTSAAIIKKRQADFRTEALKVQVTGVDDSLQLGKFKVSFFHINHNIPDSVGIVVETPVGTVVHTGDWKFDFHPVGEAPADLQKIAAIGRQGVLCLMGDSTNANRPGHQVSEKEIGEVLDRIIEKAPGRLIVGTFASLLSRVRQIIELAEHYGKHVAVEGFSMKTNVEIAREIGFIQAKKETFIPVEAIDDYEDNKVVIVCTGAQGESRAALMRIASGEHRSIKVRKSDTVIFSSSVVPGNERTVQRLMDTLYRKEARVINYEMMDVHAGGHGKKEDLKLMLSLFQPKYYVPIEGNHFLLRENADVAYSLGWPREHVFVPDNGQVMEFDPDGNGVLTEKMIPADYVFVDGLGVSDESHIVLRDRQVLAEEGMIVVILTINNKTGALVQNPDLISRGFIYLKENKQLIEDLRHRVRKIAMSHDPKAVPDPNFIKNKIRDEVGTFVFQKTRKRPMVLPVVIEV